MSLAEIYRPKCRADIIGNQKAVEQVYDCIAGSKTGIAYGTAGTGKTTTIKVIANECGYTVKETNASDARTKADFEQLLREVQSKTFKPVLFFIDEADTVDDYKGLEKCIRNAKNPVMLACNDLHKVPPSIQQICVKIRFWEPTIAEVSQVILKIERATGRVANYNCISRDFRSSINNCFAGGNHYESTTVFDDIDSFFKRGEIKQLNDDSYIWIIDNAMNFYSGKNLLDLTHLLDACDRLGTFKPLTALPKGKLSGKTDFPRFFQKAKAMKGEKR